MRNKSQPWHVGRLLQIDKKAALQRRLVVFLLQFDGVYKTTQIQKIFRKVNPANLNGMSQAIYALQVAGIVAWKYGVIEEKRHIDLSASKKLQVVAAWNILRHSDRHVPLREIAIKLNILPKNVEQLIRQLAEMGLMWHNPILTLTEDHAAARERYWGPLNSAIKNQRSSRSKSKRQYTERPLPILKSWAEALVWVKLGLEDDLSRLTRANLALPTHRKYSNLRHRLDLVTKAFEAADAAYNHASLPDFPEKLLAQNFVFIQDLTVEADRTRVSILKNAMRAINEFHPTLDLVKGSSGRAALWRDSLIASIQYAQDYVESMKQK